MEVQCPSCLRLQEDGGKSNTCYRCGLQPIPSYDYPKTSVFHPNHKPKQKGPTVDQLYKEIKKRRAAR